MIVVDPDLPVDSTSSHRTEEHAPVSMGLELLASNRAALSWPGKRLTEELIASVRRAGSPDGVESKLVPAPCVGPANPESGEAMMELVGKGLAHTHTQERGTRLLAFEFTLGCSVCVGFVVGVGYRRYKVGSYLLLDILSACVDRSVCL